MTWMMRRTFAAAVAAGGLALTAPGAVYASCIPQTEDQQRDRADVIFVGVASEGATASGVQRFQVERYLKGTGAGVVRVATGVVARSDGTGSLTSVSVVAAAGERWRIYATRRAEGTLETSVCAGSVKLAAAQQGGTVPEAAERTRSAANAVTRPAALVVVAGLLGAVAIVAVRRSRLPRR
jgi:hypothetical protein